MKIYGFKEPIYGTRLGIMFGPVFQAHKLVEKAWGGKLNFAPDKYTTARAFLPRHCMDYFLCFVSSKPTASTMAHEAVHVAQDVLWSKKGLDIRAEDGEALAYYVDWVVACVSSAVKDHNRRKR